MSKLSAHQPFSKTDKVGGVIATTFVVIVFISLFGIVAQFYSSVLLFDRCVADEASGCIPYGNYTWAATSDGITLGVQGILAIPTAAASLMSLFTNSNLIIEGLFGDTAVGQAVEGTVLLVLYSLNFVVVLVVMVEALFWNHSLIFVKASLQWAALIPTVTALATALANGNFFVRKKSAA